MKRAQTVRLKTTLRRVAIATSCFFILAISIIIVLNLGVNKEAKATANETLTSGAFIINMGIVPQTLNNGLKPYGMIYDLMVNYKIPVKWIINSAKVRDGIDFTYNAVNYSGGPFIIESENISSTIASRISYWTGQGVVGVYTTSAITVPVYNTMTVFPTVSIDNSAGKQGIITGYYSNALIPSTAYIFGGPSTLTGCVDIWTNPHGDPTWATHGSLYNFVKVYKSWIWAECHSVSAMEGCKDLVTPFNQLNFLTSKGLQCYSSTKCGPAITETHGGSPISPYTYNYPTDPVMQFMSDMHQAATGGSEDWYIPMSTGKWNNNTKQLVNTSDGTGQKKGIMMAYGPAFDDTTNGYVMYESGHDLDGSGTTAQKVSAQRAYFNFLLIGGISKQVKISSTVPSTANSGESLNISSVASSGTGPYTFKWTSLLGGSFVSSTSASTKYKIPENTTSATDILTITVTDNCSRVNFTKKSIAISGTLPIKLKSFKVNSESKGVEVKWTTASEINNDYFSVQRSLDGFNFIEIGRVRGAGNSTILLDYTFTDEHPYHGTSYYRLKQTDYDGKSETFNIVSVNLKEKLNDINEVHIYPNPFSDTFTAEFESIDKKEIQIQLLSLSGAIIYNETITIDEGKNSFHFTTPDNMKTGIYIFRVLNGSSVLSNEKVYCRRN